MEPPGRLSPDGAWRWNGQQWEPTGFVGLEPRINRLAVVAFVSALAFPLWPLSSIAAVVMGVIATRQIRQRPTERGEGLAVAAMAVGGALLVVLGLVIAAILYLGHLCRNGC